MMHDTEPTPYAPSVMGAERGPAQYVELEERLAQLDECDAKIQDLLNHRTDLFNAIEEICRDLNIQIARSRERLDMPPPSSEKKRAMYDLNTEVTR